MLVYQPRPQSTDCGACYITRKEYDKSSYPPWPENQVLQAITVAGKDDGFGAQYQACLSGLAFARKHSIYYVHTPFTQVGHGLDSKQCDLMTGLRSDRWWKVSDRINLSCVPYVKEVHECINPSAFYTEDTLSEIRDLYYASACPANVPVYDIACHIRRGDVSLNTYPFRFTSNQFYADQLKCIIKSSGNLSIAVVSQGSIDDFPELHDLPNIVFHLNEEVDRSFHILCTSSILVMSKSSFSYCAGLLSRGTVLYTDFWHKKLDKWTMIK